jgi:uncharacterized phage-like protein YoqJ
MPINKIISGAQTGVDRAALDVARELQIRYSGWCPRGRWAEDGTISDEYLNMTETPSADPKQRTEWNAKDSDGTLIILNSGPQGGTLYTIEMAKQCNKPYYIQDLSETEKYEEIHDWIKTNFIYELNIAGSRESQAPGIYKAAYSFILKLLC